MLTIVNWNWTKACHVDTTRDQLPTLLPLFGVELSVVGGVIGDNVGYAYLSKLPFAQARECSLGEVLTV